MSRKTTGSEIPETAARLLRIAAQLETGEMGPEEAAAAIRQLIDPSPFREKSKRRGRPKGISSKTALDQARDYFDLVDQGMRPTAAARIVADQFQTKQGTVSTQSVRKNADRHEGKLAEEINRETDELFYQAAQKYGSWADEALYSITRKCEEDAKQAEAAGDDVVAAAIRFEMPARRRQALIDLGRRLLDDAARARNKSDK